ncbi:MAG: Nif3-like dinuclear metal center hexameric protein [Coriobacteriales bacterium]|jgi:putative NIF3 family GTP cyclohydrolase 1 type 2|nr:Nif3-like dinuclear metal center hexameric protein [Coriobacteriales bacterium]
MAKFNIGDVEKILFLAFPAADAMPGDRFGLLAGDRNTPVSRIAISLDQTVPMINAAATAGCNLLVSHHPAFWNTPDSFVAAPSAAISNGAAIWAAGCARVAAVNSAADEANYILPANTAAIGVALLAMHTNLDCAPSCASMLLEPVGLKYTKALKPNGNGSLGQLAIPTTTEEYTSMLALEELAHRYQCKFGAVAKVWGNAKKPLHTIAICSGGAGEVIPEVIAAKADCFVTGELRHHEALYLQDCDIAIIELGHDVSELPYRFALQDALISAGIDSSDITILEPSASWWN